MTTSLSPQRVLSNKSTLIGIAVPTPTRKDGTPIPLAETPPEGFQKVRVPSVSPPREADPPPVEPARSEAPKSEPRVLTQQAIDAIKATSTPTDPDKVDASTRVTRRDLPVQGARRNMPVAASSASGVSSSSRLLVVSAALAALVLGGRWFFQHQRVAEQERAAAAPSPTGVQVVPPATDKPAADTAPSVAAAVPPPAEPTTAAASAAPEPSASNAAPASSAPAPGTRVVIVKLSPPGARLFRKGKPVGPSPYTIELGPDEKKRSYEVGMPGYVTRKLVVDGSKPEIFIGLKPR